MTKFYGKIYKLMNGFKASDGWTKLPKFSTIDSDEKTLYFYWSRAAWKEGRLLFKNNYL